MKNKAMEILAYYPITPEEAETNGNVTKVQAKEGTFALKKTRLTPDYMERFEQTLHYFEKEQLQTITPVLRTKRGNWFVRKENALYYLMPWGATPQKTPETVYFKTLALFHRQTNNPVLLEDRKDDILATKKRRTEEQINTLEAIADHIEQKRYFSPLELNYLLHFPLLANTAMNSARYVEEWLLDQEEEATMNEVYCHGSPTPDHIIVDGRGSHRFINVEKANINHPHRDVAHLYRACMENRLAERVTGYEWVYTYKEHFPTKRYDDYLLKSYLTSLPNFHVIIQPLTKRSPQEEPYVTARFMREMWLLEKMQEDMERWPAPVEAREADST